MPGGPIGQSAPADLTIRYVERLPAIDYIVNAPDPTVQGWPQPGSSVLWRAHLRNWSGRTLDGIDYTWTLDGAVTSSGSISIPPDSEATVEFPWSWDRPRHRLELRVDSPNRFTVPRGSRNRVVIDTDALAVGFYVEQSFYDYFRRYQDALGIGNSCFEDWAHLQLELYNRMLERATYPDTPQGVRDRLRLEAVHVVPDASLPLDPLAYSVGGSFRPDVARPNVADRSIDLQWGFPASALEGGVYSDHSSLGTNNQFYYSGYVQHELGHARYLVDVFAWNVFDGTSGSRIDLTEGGEHVAGSRYMPGTQVISNGVPGIRVHDTVHRGLMNTDWRYLDDYSAVALTLITGHRALNGNFNEPANLGVFLNDLPRQNQLTLREGSGRAIAGARVQVFQAAPGDSSSGFFTKRYDATPDLDLRADAQGQVQLGANPFCNDGPVVIRDDYANATIILRVQDGDRVGYGFLESSELNLEYWRGHRERGLYELSVTLH